MPKITDEDLEAIQLRLFKSDLDYLRGLFRGNVGVNKALRAVVRSYVTHTKARAAEAIDEAEGDHRVEATAELIQ